ncbi:MAG: MerR family transcriptional regulator [Rhodoglobus sp.]
MTEQPETDHADGDHPDGDHTEPDRSIHDVARLAGITTRTLRHYDTIGLLTPSRIGGNGYRHYNAVALARLQRILLLRQLGLSLSTIAEILAGQRDDSLALHEHLRLLKAEKLRIDRLIASVSSTIHKFTEGETLMAEEMFDGFDHRRHKDEVERRWGAQAYAESDRWWNSQTREAKSDFAAEHGQLAADWIAAAERGDDANGDDAQLLAARHYDWLTTMPSTPKTATGALHPAYYLGLADLYVADPRFSRNYGGDLGAAFVRAAMVAFAAHNLA